MIVFEFIDRHGRALAEDDALGYFVRDYFTCNIETANDAELRASYKGPDRVGVGVRWHCAAKPERHEPWMI